ARGRAAFVIEAEEDDESERGQPAVGSQSQTLQPKGKKVKQLPSLGERLFNSLIDLLFCCGFTLPTKIQKDHYKINYVICTTTIKLKSSGYS
ncbi:hypothetical protein MPER_03323, partial [Moniliophthora perniciosa FA553]